MDKQIHDYLHGHTVEWLVSRIYEHNLNARADMGSSSMVIRELGSFYMIDVNDVLGVIFEKLGRKDLVLK